MERGDGTAVIPFLCPPSIPDASSHVQIAGRKNVGASGRAPHRAAFSNVHGAGFWKTGHDLRIASLDPLPWLLTHPPHLISVNLCLDTFHPSTMPSPSSTNTPPDHLNTVKSEGTRGFLVGAARVR
jgi:hypothetical protein